MPATPTIIIVNIHDTEFSVVSKLCLHTQNNPPALPQPAPSTAVIGSPKPILSHGVCIRRSLKRYAYPRILVPLVV